MSQITRLCLGTACLGMPGYGLHTRQRTTHAEAEAILRQAGKRGVTWYDTAAAYGEAEDLVRFFTNYWAVKRITKLSTTLVGAGDGRRIDEWDLVLVHNPTVSELNDDALMSWPTKLHNSSRWGASVYTPEEAHAAIAAGLRVIQIPYHALDQRHARAGVFEAAKAAGVFVMARQPWCRGVLLRAGMMAEPGTEAAAEDLSDYWRICANHIISPLEAGLRFSLESPADVIVFGCSSVAQLNQDLDIAESDPPAAWPTCYAELCERFKDSGLTLGSVCT